MEPKQKTIDKPLVAQERVAAVVLGRETANKLIKPDAGLSHSIRHADHTEIENIIENLDFYDETSRYVAGMGVCLPSLLAYEKSHNKNTEDFLKTILFNHYLKQYIETIESPEPINLLMNNLKGSLAGYRNVNADKFLSIFQDVVKGQWNEAAFRNSLCAFNCIAADPTVEEDRQFIDILVPGFDEFFVPIDVKSSPGSLPVKTSLSFISNEGIDPLYSARFMPHEPGFAVGLDDYHGDTLILVMAGTGGIYSKIPGYKKDPDSPSGVSPTIIKCINPIPRFGKQYGELDFDKAVDNLRYFFSSLPQEAKIVMTQKELESRFSVSAIKQLFN